MIPYGKQDINQADIDMVVEVLGSDFLTQGPKVPEFESELIKSTGAKYALALNSATSALHIACLALGLGPGDRFWTSPITFVASANCGLYCGAIVDFVDIDPVTYNLCPKALELKLIDAKAKGVLPKVVIPVHLCGQPCDMRKIHELSQEFGFKIIEDASHAIGASYLNEKVGNCRYSDITVFSFHPVKIITTAEGGAAMTNNELLADNMALYRSHGITRDKSKLQYKYPGDWYYEQIELGYNYRMTDLQGALGVSQIRRLDDFVAARHRLSNRYNELLSDLPLKLPVQLKGTYSGLHLYVVRLELDHLRCSQREVFESLRAQGIGVNLHYIPVHTQPYYQRMGFAYGDFPHAEAYYKEAISLPMFHTLTATQQDQVVKIFTAILEG